MVIPSAQNEKIDLR